MAHQAHLKRKDIELRTQGMALDDIVLRLASPHTTVYGWVSYPSTERADALSAESTQYTLQSHETDGLRLFWNQLVKIDSTQIRFSCKSNGSQNWRGEHGVLSIRKATDFSDVNCEHGWTL